MLEARVGVVWILILLKRVELCFDVQEVSSAYQIIEPGFHKRLKASMVVIWSSIKILES
jgi:hypothetical protein